MTGTPRDGFDSPDGRTYSEPVTATPRDPAPFHWHGTAAEFDAEVRRRWIESSEQLGLDHGMPNAAAAIAAPRDEAGVTPGLKLAFENWFGSQGYDEDGRFDMDEMEFAFEAGAEAERDQAAIAAQPQPGPGLGSERDQLREITGYHNDLLDEILRNTGDEWDGDEAAEAIAVRYVRHLESLVPPALRVPEGRRDGVQPAPELAADDGYYEPGSVVIRPPDEEEIAVVPAPELAAANHIIREILESLCRRDGLSLESTIEPGEPARNYALAERLGIGHVFGLADTTPQPASELADLRRRIEDLAQALDHTVTAGSRTRTDKVKSDIAKALREMLAGQPDPNHEPGLSECGCRQCDPARYGDEPAPELAALESLREFARDGHWLTCEDDGRLDMRKELLAVKAAVREVLKQPAAELAAHPPSPEPDGTIVIGPQCFASADSRVISWRGINYYPWASDPDHQVLPAPELAAMAQLADEMFAEAQMIAPAYGEPDGMPDMADQIRAEVLHETSGRIRAVAGDVEGQPRLRDGIEGLIEDLEQSAKATAPSTKTAIEQTVAERLRTLLDQP